MSEYIGKQEAINYCREKQKEIDCERSKALYDCFIEIIKKQPAADVQEVRHGKWVQNKHVKRIFYCSECGRHIEDGAEYKNVSEHFPYCHCGARMDGDEK